jgi:hypothetical protein
LEASCHSHCHWPFQVGMGPVAVLSQSDTVITFALFNVILTANLGFPDSESVIAVLESMEPPGKDMQIVRSNNIVPWGVGGNVPSSLVTLTCLLSVRGAKLFVRLVCCLQGKK